MTSEQGAPLLERYLPTYDTTETCGAVVEATPEATWEAALRADLCRSVLLRAVLGVRGLPGRVRALRQGRSAPELRPPLTLADMTPAGFVRLGERPGAELVLGAVSQPWKAITTGIPPALEGPDAFLAFDEPGYLKLAVNVRVEPHGTSRSLLTTETRALATDPISRHRYLRYYWVAIGPLNVLVRRALLGVVKDEAEP